MNALTQLLHSHGIDPFLAGLFAGVLLTLALWLALRPRRESDEEREPVETGKAGRKRAVLSENVTLHVNMGGSDASLSDEDSAAVLRALRGNDKVTAIKLIRSATGLELTDARRLATAMEKAHL
jgi:hypothetical protein